MAAFTTIDDPSAHFQVASYTGDGNDNRQVTNDGNSNLQPDFVWIKDRTQAEANAVFDSSRGASIRLKTDDNTQESTESATLKSFTSDGFTVGTSGSVNNGSNPDEYVAFQWKANGGTTSTNSDGDINTTVQANDTAGFSIVTYSGSSSGSKTVASHLPYFPRLSFSVFMTTHLLAILDRTRSLTFRPSCLCSPRTSGVFIPDSLSF